MKIAFDIGGVISKYPKQFKEICLALFNSGIEIYIITDMHDRDKILDSLNKNGFGFISSSNIYSANYEKHGEMCKSILLKELGIDLMIDDFPGYLTWDSKLGNAPIRLQVMPDGFNSYWHESWITDDADGDFGRRKCSDL